MSILLKIREVESRFQGVEDFEDRFRLLMEMGKELPEMNEQFKVEKFRIKGCQSQVWLHPEFKDGEIHFQADSDALLVKGIIALLVQVYSGQTPDAILEEKEDFLKNLGITDHLSMNRSNGLAAMTKQIKMYAIAYKSMQGA